MSSFFMLDVWLWNETLFFYACVVSRPQVLHYHLKDLKSVMFFNRLCRLCLDFFNVESEQICFPRVSQQWLCSLFLYVRLCVLCLCTRIVVCNMCVAVFYLHSKDLIKVSRLTQQLMVNLASFSHSPTHDLSIFPTVSDHIQACCCSEEVCIYSSILLVGIRVCWDENDLAKLLV